MANKLRYRKAWGFPAQVEDFIASKMNGYTVHVMCGESRLGDLRIDKYVETADLAADVFKGLPVESGIADTVICDPPWGMDYTLKPQLMRELRLILKFGGRLIFNAPWSPKCPGLALEEIWVPTWQLMSFSNVALVWIARKIKGSLFDVSEVTDNEAPGYRRN